MPRASQVGGNASQFPGRVYIRIGAFNYGIEQQMIESVNWNKKYRERFLDICHKALDGEALDCLFGCEVGGHRQGLLDYFGDVQEVFRDSIMLRRYKISSLQAYMAMWNTLAMSWQPGVPEMRELRPSILRQLSASQEVDVQLVVSMYEVKNYEGTMCYLIVGNMHIRTPQKPKNEEDPLYEHKKRAHAIAKHITFRRKVTKQALLTLEGIELGSGLSSSAPCAVVLLGDCNLFPAQAEEMVQQRKNELGNIWCVRSSEMGKQGDLMFIKGVVKAVVFNIPIGVSYKDKGMRNDNHDAFGVEIAVGGIAQHTARPIEPSRLAFWDNAVVVEIPPAPVLTKAKPEHASSSAEEHQAESKTRRVEASRSSREPMEDSSDIEQHGGASQPAANVDADRGRTTSRGKSYRRQRQDDMIVETMLRQLEGKDSARTPSPCRTNPRATPRGSVRAMSMGAAAASSSASSQQLAAAPKAASRASSSGASSSDNTVVLEAGPVPPKRPPTLKQRIEAGPVPPKQPPALKPDNAQGPPGLMPAKSKVPPPRAPAGLIPVKPKGLPPLKPDNIEVPQMEVEAPQMEFTPPDWSTDEDESYKNDETDDADESDEADDADESYKTDLWRDLLKWFREKINALDDDGPDRVLERMQKIIFKKVKKVHSSDIWHPDRVTQPEEEEGNEEEKEEEEEEQEEEEESGGNHHLVMVSKEYTAVLIKATLMRREDYLRKRGLPLEYNMYDDEQDVLKPFLEEVRTEYESEAHQRKLQERDHRRKKDGTSKRTVHAGKRRRGLERCNDVAAASCSGSLSASLEDGIQTGSKRSSTEIRRLPRKKKRTKKSKTNRKL